MRYIYTYMAWHGKSLQLFKWSWVVLWPGFAGLHYTCWACPASRVVPRPAAREKQIGTPAVGNALLQDRRRRRTFAYLVLI